MAVGPLISVTPERAHYFVYDLTGFAHAARAAGPARQHTRAGRDEAHSALRKRPHILLGSGVFKHGGIHRRRDEHRRVCRHYRSGQHIVRDTAGELSYYIGRGGRYHEYVGALSQGDMLYLPGLNVCKRVYAHRVMAERLKR